MPILPILVFSGLAIGLLGAGARRYSADRNRHRELAWPPEKAARLREIRDAIEGSALLQNVDPWGEIAANQIQKISERFAEFEKRLVRAFRSDWSRGRAIHTDVARVFWSELNRLERVSAQLRKLDLSDPAYYRSILHSAVGPDEELDPKQSAFAKAELEAHRRLEDELQQELMQGEQTMLLFDRLVSALDQPGNREELDSVVQAIRAQGAGTSEIL